MNLIVAFLRERKVHLLIVLSYFFASFFSGYSLGSDVGFVNVFYGLVSIFLIFCFVYVYNSFIDLYLESDSGKKNMFAGADISKSMLVLFFAVMFFMSLFVSYLISIQHFVMISVIGLFGFIYSHPKIGFKRRGTFAKSFSIVFCYMLMFVYFGLLFSDSYLVILVFALYFGSLSLSGTIFRDVKDRRSDKLSDVSTLATRFSDKILGGFFDLITVVVYGLIVVLSLGSVLSSFYVLMLFVVPLRLYFTANLRSGRYRRAGKASLYSYIFSALIIFIVWLFVNVY